MISQVGSQVLHRLCQSYLSFVESLLLEVE
jgi:hypothetical protein